MSIEKIRREIDAVDDQLAVLMKTRFDLSKAMGEEKKKIRRAVYDPAREKAILRRVEEAAAPYGEEVRGVYEKIMEFSRRLQR
ncbi:MAG: chorismate mutase [Peptoniphilus sp.]|nr:chorismate mutase [Peptoniphilus sp.]MDY3118370.1 chorismate mutase [Peptoniphilus sp.]